MATHLVNGGKAMKNLDNFELRALGDKLDTLMLGRTVKRTAFWILRYRDSTRLRVRRFFQKTFYALHPEAQIRRFHKNRKAP